MTEETEYMEQDLELENAVIERASIFVNSNGLLSAWIRLKYKNGVQNFGGFGMYLPKSFANHSLESPAGHFIYRLMEVAGVRAWDELESRAVRIKHSASYIQEIGHIVNDDWFCPEKDFEPIFHGQEKEEA